ncbi:MAG: VCBS repeat-containing protein [Calothrix sp. CSU_2_0]|nr:VCBS repeat-containing protein [Calothrix sp. CSU_2_0]
MLTSDNSFAVSSNHRNFNHSTNSSVPLSTESFTDKGNISLPLPGKSSASLRHEPLVQPLGANPSQQQPDKSWWINPDFNGDGKTDIFWHNNLTHDNNWWLMNGSSVDNANVSINFRTDENWKYQVGDMDGDGKSDLVWRNFVTGQNTVWLMDGSNVLKDFYVLPIVDSDIPNWNFKLGDTNGDRKMDLIWRNYKTGQNIVWQMNRETISGFSFLNPVNSDVSDAKWDFEIANSNGDTRSDLIWYNRETGQIYSWILNESGLNIETEGLLPTVGDLDWKFKIADTDGNGKTDLVWRNYRTGDNTIWFLKDNGLEYNYRALVDKLPDLNWDFGVVDTNGDGKSDLVWRNYKTGENTIWKISISPVDENNLATGVIEKANSFPAIIDLNWDFNIGDYNGDGKSDLLWRNFQTGENQLWFLDNLKVQDNGVANIIPLPKGWVFL